MSGSSSTGIGVIMVWLAFWGILNMKDDQVHSAGV